MEEKLKTTIQKFKDQNVLVIGDAMLDEYTWGSVNRISPEAPVPILSQQKEDQGLGGACNVANNLHTFGAKVSYLGVIGDDASGKIIETLLKKQGMSAELIKDDSRKTTRKRRYMGASTGGFIQMLRVDAEDTHPISEDIRKRILDKASKVIDKCGAVIISDYNKGGCRGIIEGLRKINAKIPIFLDPKPMANDYKGTTTITPNIHDTLKYTGIDCSKNENLEKAAKALIKMFDVKQVLITCGPGGIYCYEDNKGELVPAYTQEVADVSGAGDVAMVVLTLGQLCGLSLVDAAHLANYASGCAIRKQGISIINADELLAYVEKMNGKK